MEQCRITKPRILLRRSREVFYLTGLPKWRVGYFIIMEFITTFKKLNKSSSQSIFEYIILTCLLITLLLGFSQTSFFRNIKSYLEASFDRAVVKIVEAPAPG